MAASFCARAVAKWCFVSGARGSWAAACRRRTARPPGGHRDQCGAALDGRAGELTCGCGFSRQVRASDRKTHVCTSFGGAEPEPELDEARGTAWAAEGRGERRWSFSCRRVASRVRGSDRRACVCEAEQDGGDKIADFGRLLEGAGRSNGARRGTARVSTCINGRRVG